MARVNLLRSGAEEPYRVFFPLGVLCGLVAVSLWPAWLAGWLTVYPATAHARMMTEGFFGAFIFGFLGTAGPRMLEAGPLSGRLWILLAVAWLVGQGASLAHAHNLAEGGFILALALLLGALGQRWPRRTGLPPPGFVLVVASLAGALVAALFQSPWLLALWPRAPAVLWLTGKSFLHETWILLPILGTAPFFFGRFGGLPPRHQTRDAPETDALWRHQAMICLATGLVLAVAIATKSLGFVRAGAIVQAAVTAIYLWTQVPFRYRRPVPTLARGAQLALVMLVLAPLGEALWPQAPLAWRHLLLIGGFQFVVVVVATWVVFSHAGEGARCRRRWPVLGLILASSLAAALTRAAAEFLPAIRATHLAYAALFWLAGSVAWLILLFPRLREEDDA